MTITGPAWRGNRIATRRPARLSCARLSGTGNMGSHEEPVVAGETHGTSSQTGEGRAASVGPLPVEGVSRAGRRSQWDIDVGPGGGDFRGSLQGGGERPPGPVRRCQHGRGGDAEGFLSSAWISGSARPAATCGRILEVLGSVTGAGFFVLRDESNGMTVTAHALFPLRRRACSRFSVTVCLFPLSGASPAASQTGPREFRCRRWWQKTRNPAERPRTP